MDPTPRRIPILISLRDYELAGSIEQLISDELNRRGLTIDSSFIKGTPWRKEIVLLMDAFDEMSFVVERVSVQRNLQLINNLVKQIGACVISCRTHFFRDQIEERQFQTVQLVYLVPWGDSEITNYLQKAVGSKWEAVLNIVKGTYNLTELAQLGLFPPPDPEANKAIVRRLIEEAWNQRKLDVIDETIAPEFIYHITGMPEVHGPEGFKEFVNIVKDCFMNV